MSPEEVNVTFSFTEMDFSAISNGRTNITWHHVFGLTGHIKFTESNGRFSIEIPFDGEILPSLSVKVPPATYDIEMWFDAGVAENHFPFTATGTNVDIATDTQVELIADTEYAVLIVAEQNIGSLEPAVVEVDGAGNFTILVKLINSIENPGFRHAYVKAGTQITLLIYYAPDNLRIDVDILVEAKKLYVFTIANPSSTNLIIDLNSMFEEINFEIGVGGLSIQQRLDNGETPLEIYNSNNDFLDLLYGKRYQGGLIFYFDTSTGSGLVTTPNDLGQVVWGCFGTTISGADGTAIGTGLQNTLDILTGCFETGIAARLCADLSLSGYDDWFLPSKDELNMLWVNAEAVAGNGDDFIVGIGYWSSSESSSNLSWSQDLSSGFQNDGGNGKTDLYFVRAVRAF